MKTSLYALLLLAPLLSACGDDSKPEDDAGLPPGGYFAHVDDEPGDPESLVKACKDRDKWGTFEGEPYLEPEGYENEYQDLLKPYVFATGRSNSATDRWVAAPTSDEAPWSWNGSSIPGVFQWAFGEPKVGCHLYASVVHDYLYQRADDHKLERIDTDRMYYWGVRAKGVGRIRGKLMYFALRRFGGRNFQRNGLVGSELGDLAEVSRLEQRELLKAAAEWIEAEDPELDALDTVSPEDPLLAAYR